MTAPVAHHPGHEYGVKRGAGRKSDSRQCQTVKARQLLLFRIFLGLKQLTIILNFGSKLVVANRPGRRVVLLAAPLLRNVRWWRLC